MRKRRTSLCFPLTASAALGAALLAGSVPAAAADNFTGALIGGKPTADLRLRYESVDQANALKDANAATLRLRLGYETGQYHGFGALVEAETVTALGGESYNSTVNGKTAYSIVADPEATEINQAYLSYAGLADTTLKYGRQRIILDNHRFIGNVGWRQNEQTYDAVTLKSAALPKTQLQYSFISNVNRITGPGEGAQPANYHGAVHVLNGKVDLGQFGAVAGFAYLLDLENAPALSSSTFGLHWTGIHKMSGDTKLNWIASYATQSDYADNPNRFSANYYLLEGGATFGRFGLRAGYEVLGGDSRPNRAFQTPLATLHAFNGWADKFLTTPAGGIEDLYVGGSASVGPVALQLVWHDYQAEAIDMDYGSEWNASAAMKFGAKKNYEAMLKFADYRADRFATDTTKVWVQVSAAF